MIQFRRSREHHALTAARDWGYGHSVARPTRLRPRGEVVGGARLSVYFLLSAAELHLQVQKTANFTCLEKNGFLESKSELSTRYYFSKV